MVQLRYDVVGLDAAINMSPRAWEGSGHVDVFTDPLVECLNLHQRFRSDHLPGSHTPESAHQGGCERIDLAAGTARCPNCGHDQCAFTVNFNPMLRTHMGPLEDAANAAY